MHSESVRETGCTGLWTGLMHKHTYKHTHIHVAGVYSVSHCVNTCTGVKLFMLIDNLNPAREGWNVACHHFNSSSASVPTCKEQSTSSYIMGESAIEIADSTLSSTCMAVLPVPKCWCLLWLCLWKRSHTKYIYIACTHWLSCYPFIVCSQDSPPPSVTHTGTIWYD